MKFKFKKPTKKTVLLSTAVIAGVVIIGGGVYMVNSNAPIQGAYKSLVFDKSQTKSFEDTYQNKSLERVVLSKWTGRNNGVIQNVNDNKLTKSEIGLIDATGANVVPMYALNVANGQYYGAQLLYATASIKKGDDSKIKDSDFDVAKKITSENSGKLNILHAQHVFDTRAILLADQKESNVTMMTDQAAQFYKDKLANTIDEKDADYMFVRSIPVYRNQTDLVPVGYQLQARAVKSPSIGVDQNGKPKTAAKLGNFEYNVYIRNAQEGFKIDYATGKVTYDTSNK